MIEGLWVAKFLEPTSDEFDLDSGVLVIESGRVLGGDSGYYYVGQLTPAERGWKANVTVVRHDPKITSFFGDSSRMEFGGSFLRAGVDQLNRDTLIAELKMEENPNFLKVLLTKVADLP